MAKTSLANIKNWFLKGLKPTQAQFWAMFDSFWHKDEKISQSNVNQLAETLDAKVEKQAFETHLNDINSHKELFDLKLDKSEAIKSQWQGRKLCYYGTSISENTRGQGETENIDGTTVDGNTIDEAKLERSYPNILGRMLGAEVVNYSRGGMSLNFKSDGTIKALGSFCATLDEYADAVINEDNVSISGGDLNRDYMRSYENVWLNQNADLYILDVAPNNASFGLEEWNKFDIATKTFSDGSSFADNRYTYLGCLLFLYNQLMIENPYAQVVLVSMRHKPEYIEDALFNTELFARTFSLPHINITDKQGFNAYNDAILVPDGTHQNQFATYNTANLLYGEFLKIGSERKDNLQYGELIENQEVNKLSNLIRAWNDNSVIWKRQIARWNGAGFSDSDGMFIGKSAGDNASTANSHAIGTNAMQNASGLSGFAAGTNAGQNTQGDHAVVVGPNSGRYMLADQGIAMGLSALERAIGFGITGIAQFSGRYAIGDFLAFFGAYSGEKFTGNKSVGIGFNALSKNQGDNLTVVGNSESQGFLLDNPRAKTFANTDVNTFDSTININGHGFGDVDTWQLVFFSAGTSTNQGSFSTTSIYQVYIIDVDTIQLYREVNAAPSIYKGVQITNAGDGTDYVFTPHKDISNSSAFGANAKITKANQVVLGDENVTEVITSGYHIAEGFSTPANDGKILLNNGNEISLDSLLKLVTGYNATNQQTLKNSTGTIEWVDDAV